MSLARCDRYCLIDASLRIVGLNKSEPLNHTLELYGFVTGFFFLHKVVIFDTLIESFTNSEILGVVCHELDHVANHHIVWKIVSSSFRLHSFSVFSPSASATSTGFVHSS